ncbi:hypothetical protein BDR03DRAFT_943473 [Suillus americanus]|nr:hypothetical protein BDR03DRAFT_943473 [Suillus americanus]
MCAHPNCLPLVLHITRQGRPSGSLHEAHPPTCIHPSCNGQTVAFQHNLRVHQKLHEQQELEAVLAEVEPSEATDLRRKCRSGGEVGKSCKCDKCGREFKYMNALMTHNVIHLGHRNHVCPH